jgi:hypothetical protein
MLTETNFALDTSDVFGDVPEPLPFGRTADVPVRPKAKAVFPAR